MNNEREDSKIAKMKKIQKSFKEATFVVGFSWFAFAKIEYRSFFLKPVTEQTRNSSL